MARQQRYGIKYPFTSNNEDKIFMDTNDTYVESIKSKVLHVIFTPKGQKIRDPEFGTDLIKYVFSPADSEAFSNVKSEISSQITKYVPSVEFRDIDIYKGDDNSIIVDVEYGITRGNKTDITKVAVKL